MKTRSEIWKPKNQLFCDQKAIISLRLHLFQQSKVYSKRQQLFYLVIKLTKLLALPKARVK